MKTHHPELVVPAVTEPGVVALTPMNTASSLSPARSLNLTAGPTGNTSLTGGYKKSFLRKTKSKKTKRKKITKKNKRNKKKY